MSSLEEPVLTLEPIVHDEEKLEQELCEFILERDPAATSLEQVREYPGVVAIRHYRRAHYLYQMARPDLERGWAAETAAGKVDNELEKKDLLRLAKEHYQKAEPARSDAEKICRYAQSLTGIDINPGAIIEEPVFLDHGTALVIGETSIIRKRTTLYHGVTMGAGAPHTNDSGEKRHPEVGENSFIGLGSKIVGPIRLGNNSKVDVSVTINGANIGDNCSIGADTHIKNPTLKRLTRNRKIFSDIGNDLRTGNGAVILDCETIGDNVRVGHLSKLIKTKAGNNIIIGDNSSAQDSEIADGVKIGDAVRIHGAKIGKGAIIENDTIVTADVAPGEIIKAGTVHNKRSQFVKLDAQGIALPTQSYPNFNEKILDQGKRDFAVRIIGNTFTIGF